MSACGARSGVRSSASAFFFFRSWHRQASRHAWTNRARHESLHAALQSSSSSIRSPTATPSSNPYRNRLFAAANLPFNRPYTSPAIQQFSQVLKKVLYVGGPSARPLEPAQAPAFPRPSQMTGRYLQIVSGLPMRKALAFWKGAGKGIPPSRAVIGTAHRETLPTLVAVTEVALQGFPLRSLFCAAAKMRPSHSASRSR